MNHKKATAPDDDNVRELQTTRHNIHFGVYSLDENCFKVCCRKVIVTFSHSFSKHNINERIRYYLWLVHRYVYTHDARLIITLLDARCCYGIYIYVYVFEKSSASFIISSDDNLSNFTWRVYNWNHRGNAYGDGWPEVFKLLRYSLYIYKITCI